MSKISNNSRSIWSLWFDTKYFSPWAAYYLTRNIHKGNNINKILYKSIIGTDKDMVNLIIRKNTYDGYRYEFP